jgi:hypothetical protein
MLSNHRISTFAQSLWLFRVFLLWLFLFGLSSLQTAAAVCIFDFNDIYRAENAVTNTNVKRTYIICPNKVYGMGYLDYNYNLRKQNNDIGQPPLPLRPNIRYQCGNDGSRTNECYISDGDIHLDGTMIRGIDDARVDNVEIVGFTFQKAIKHSLWVTKPGSLTFQDCEWKVRWDPT